MAILILDALTAALLAPHTYRHETTRRSPGRSIVLAVAVVIGCSARSGWCAADCRRAIRSTAFAWGQNLKPGQPVLLAGVNVGYVGDINLARTGTLDVDAADHQGLRRARQARWRASSLTASSATWRSRFGAKGPSPVHYTPATRCPSGKPSVTMADLLARLDTVSRGVRTMSDAFTVELVQNRGIADLRETLEQSARFMRQLNTIAAQQSIEISRTTAALRRTAGAIDSASVDSTVRNLQATSANMTQLTSDLQQTTTHMNSLLAKLDNGQGTAGKLLTDTLLYQDLRNVVGRVDSLTADFKRNPKKYINLRIF